MGTVRSRTNMKTTKNSVFTTNGVGNINGSNSSSVLDDLIDSVVFPEDFGVTDTSQIIKHTKVTITTAEILSLNSANKTLIAAPGAGKMIDVISVQYFLDYNSIAYATNTSLWIGFSNTDKLHTTAFTLAASGNKYIHRPNLDFAAYYVGSTPLPVNANLIAYVASGNPTAGDSDLYVYITYRILTL